VFKRNVEGDVTKAEKCKIAVYSCPLDILQTETKVCNKRNFKMWMKSLSVVLTCVFKLSET
jgi:hypothetical protein